MTEIEIRALKQNASELIADATADEVVTITLRGRQVAGITAITSSRLEGLVSSGRARPPRRNIADLPAPTADPCLTEVLEAMRTGVLGTG